ncbi:MAG TPA: helix-turn-helix transcriptional regulator [Opitutaceae bacterium]|nr:helix-turn-helix transcriptional regulator [Opitutaceae bacterium]
MKKNLLTLHMLDQLGADLSGLRARNIPAWGWLWTVRKASGLSTREIGEAEGISARAVSLFEYSEAHGRIQLGKLASLADILGCQLVYAVTSFKPECIQQMQEVAARRKKPLDVSKEPSIPQYLEKSGMPPGGWLKRMRLCLGYSRADVAKKLGISRESIVKFEETEARGTISLNSLRKVAAAIDCELIYFLTNNGTVAPTFINRLIPAK